MLQKGTYVVQLVTIALACCARIHCSVFLPSGLERVLAYQGNLSLHDAAISEPIFELLEPQQYTEKAVKIRVLKEARLLQ